MMKGNEIEYEEMIERTDGISNGRNGAGNGFREEEEGSEELCELLS